MRLKRCTKCGKVKFANEFYGKYNECRECRSLISKPYYKKKIWESIKHIDGIIELRQTEKHNIVFKKNEVKTKLPVYFWNGFMITRYVDFISEMSKFKIIYRFEDSKEERDDNCLLKRTLFEAL